MADGNAPAPGDAAPRRRGCLGSILTALGAAYVLNPTAGVLELLPDNLPVVGNLDEVLATAIALIGLRLLGVDPLKLAGRGRGSSPSSSGGGTRET